MGLDVVELQERLFGAPPSVGGDVGALAGVLAPDFTLDRSRGLARTRSIRSRTDNRAGTRLGRGAELLVLDTFQQQSHGAVKDRRGVTVGDLTTEQRLKAAKLVVGLLANGELDPVALRGRRLDDRTDRPDECCR
jgi:hypothetical protein